MKGIDINQGVICQELVNNRLHSSLSSCIDWHSFFNLIQQTALWWWQRTKLLIIDWSVISQCYLMIVWVKTVLLLDYTVLTHVYISVSSDIGRSEHNLHSQFHLVKFQSQPSSIDNDNHKNFSTWRTICTLVPSLFSSCPEVLCKWQCFNILKLSILIPLTDCNWVLAAAFGFFRLCGVCGFYSL